MRRQDAWLALADRMKIDRRTVVAVCAFLNMQRDKDWIAAELALTFALVDHIASYAKPLLRQTRRTPRANPAGKRACAYCGTSNDLTKDHVIPRSRGGSDTAANLVWACRNCNSAKGDRTPQEWLG